jgi:hypothetical protein
VASQWGSVPGVRTGEVGRPEPTSRNMRATFGLVVSKGGVLINRQYRGGACLGKVAPGLLDTAVTSAQSEINTGECRD